MVLTCDPDSHGLAISEVSSPCAISPQFLKHQTC